MKIVTVTLNTAIDVVVDEKEYKETGLGSAVKIPAGKGINVSRALKCGHIPSLAIALVGENEEGLYSYLSDDYISMCVITVCGSTRRNITLTNCADNEEHHTREKGFTVSEHEIEAVAGKLLDNVGEGDWVVFSGSLPPGATGDTYARLIELCKTQGAYTALDTSGDGLILGIKASPYLIKPNLEELVQIASGNPVDSRESIMECMRSISLSNDIPLILTTLSGEGAIMYSGEHDETEEIKALPLRKEIVTSVGCGDCSLAGFLSGLVRHKDYRECLREAMIFAGANLYTIIPGDLDIEKSNH